MGQGQSDNNMNVAPVQQPEPTLGLLLKDNLKNLSKFEQFFFDYSFAIVSANSVACGLMAHNLFRKTLKIRRRYLLSALPVTAIPMLCTGLYHEVLVTYPLIEGSLTCSVCAMMRGSYIGVCIGGVAPILLAAFVNLRMVPEVLRPPVKGGVIREMFNFTKPVFSRLKYFLLFEAAFSAAVTAKQFDTMEKLLQMEPVAEIRETPKK